MRAAVLVKSVGALVAVVAVVLALVWVFQRRLIYLPDTSTPPPASAVLPGGVDVTLRTADGLDLGAWYVPADAARCDVTVLVANGNGGNRRDRAALGRALTAEGLGVLLFDYRGYGGNDGDPTEEGLARDIRSAHAFLRDELGPTAALLYFGESLGAGVVTELAVEHPPAAMVLRSPFIDLAAAGQDAYPFLPVRWLLRDRFPVQEGMSRIRVPTTVIAGDSDRVIDPGQSRQVWAASHGEPGTLANEFVEVAGADHNDPALASGPEVVAATVRAARLVGRC